MSTQIGKETKPKVTQCEISIPDGLSILEGELSRTQRVEIALDVIATLKSRQRKFVLGSRYFDPSEPLPAAGPLNSAVIKKRCMVCARGMLFIKSLDRFNNFNLEDHDPTDSEIVVVRTEDEWGYYQAKTIERSFEMRGYEYEPGFIFAQNNGGLENRKSVMIAICENIVANHGEFKP